MAGCEYCLDGVPILSRGSRRVSIRHNEDREGGYVGFKMEMWWRTPGGHWHMEWMPIVACPMCGTDLMRAVNR